MLPTDCEIRVVNASASVGITSKSQFPANTEHIQAQIDKYKPAIILGCGKVAHAGLDKLEVSYIAVPHPAYRALSNKRTAQIRRMLQGEI